MKLCKVGSVAVSSLMIFGFMSTNAEAQARVIFKDIYNKHQGFVASPMSPSIANVVKTMQKNKPDLYQIVVYKMKDHYLLYQLSSTEWKSRAIKVKINLQGKIEELHPTPADKTELDQATTDETPKCPDESVQFVAISGYPGVGGVNKAIASVSEAAKKKFKTVTILGDKADGKTYKNWLQCSNLKGFFSVSHGAPDEIVVGNGDVINYRYFKDKGSINKLKSALVIINACQAYNYPFGSEVMYGNAKEATTYATNPGPHAYEYVSGQTNLKMVDSEVSSACFMAEAINGAKMDYDTMRTCVGKKDFNYLNFGISQPGRLLNQSAVKAG